MHNEALDYCKKVAASLPQYFDSGNVLIVGSKEMNGNKMDGALRRLFGKGATVIGIDQQAGEGVDFVCNVRDYARDKPVPTFNTIVCTEMLEHDEEWRGSVAAMLAMLAPKGLLLITCATGSRTIHGTKEGSGIYCGPHYENVEWDQFAPFVGLDSEPNRGYWHTWNAGCNPVDLYFHGIKGGK